MAGPLTWRNVDAPDFRGSLAGLSIASNSLDRAFAGLGEGLSRFDAARKEDAASAVLNNSMNYADPAALRAAIADGSVFNGVNRGLLNPAAFAGLDSRAGTLLSQATNQQVLDTNRQMDPLRIAGQRATNQGLENKNTFDTRTLDERVRGIGLDNQATEANIDSSRAGTASTRQQTAQRGTEFGWRRDDQADRQAALPWIERLKTGAVDTQGAYDILGDPEFQKLSPQARSHVLSAVPGIQGFSGVLGAPVAGAPGSVGAGPAIAAAAGAPGTRSGNVADVTFGFRPTPVPLSSMPLSGVLDHQEGMIRDQGHSPVGAFQFTRDTLRDVAPRVLGANWQSQPFSFENQDRLARALYEERKSGNLSQTWSTLPDRGVGGYANVPYEQVRPFLVRAEAGGNISSIPQLRSEVTGARVQANRAVSEIAGTQAENRSGGIIPGYTEAQADFRSTENQIAEKLQSTYQGLPIARLVQDIQDLRTQYPQMTAATAGLILERSFSPSGRVMRNLPSAIGGGQGTPDMTRAVELAKSAQRGETFAAVEQDQLLGAQGASLVAAQQAHEQAAASLAAAVRRGPLAAAQVPRLQGQLNQARSALAAAVSRQSNDDTTQLSFNRGRDAPGTQPANVPGALPYARVDTDRLQDPGPAQPAAARPGPTPAAAALLDAVMPPADAPVDPLADTLRRAAEERQAVITRDDQARAQRTALAQTALVHTAAADAQELVNSGISLREAAQMAATAPGIRGRGVTAASIEDALRKRLAREQ